MVSLDIAQLSIESQNRIDDLCQVYETQLRSSQDCDPLSLLSKVPERESPVLLFELLRLHAEIQPGSGVFDQVRQERPDYAWIVELVSTADAPNQVDRLAPAATVDADYSERELVARDGDREHVFSLAIPGQYVLGTGSDVDLRLAGSGLPRRAACLLLESDRCLLVSLAAGDATLRELNYSSPFVMGDISFEFRSPSYAAPSHVGPSALPSDTRSLPEIGIDGFQMTRELGSGSFGVVYEVTQLGTEKRFAIKSLLPDAARSERLKTLFMREISIVSQLKHPNIVGYHGFGIAEEHPYLILEYVAHQPIENILQTHPEHKRLRLCIGILRKTLAALQYAHEQGVVHRDVKLSNLLAGVQDRRLFVKLTDFGLSKFFETAGYSGITASDAVCGTIAYMSPEQLTNSKYAEPDCDVYAAAVCLYRLLTGRFPHDSESPAETIHKRMNVLPVAIDEHDPSLPAELSILVQRALHVDPFRRFKTADEFARALEPFGL